MKFAFTQIFSVLLLLLSGIFMGWVLRKVQGNSVISYPARIKQLEGLRALAALAVASCHVTQHILVNFNFSETPQLSNSIGILGVEMFFALTAFLFTRSLLEGKLDLTTFFMSRIRRLVPLYFFACILAITMVAILTHHRTEPIPQMLSEIYQTFCFGFVGGDKLNFRGENMLSYIGVAWTLHYEWAFYFFIPILAIALRSKSGIIIAFIIYLITSTHSFLFLQEAPWTFFIAGVIAALLEKKVPAISSNKKKFFSLIAIILLCGYFFLPGFFSFPRLLLVTALFFCILISEPKILKADTLQYLATISYSIYLLQYIILMSFMGFISYFPILFPLPILQTCFLGMVVMALIPFSHITYHFIELPWMKRNYSPWKFKFALPRLWVRTQ